MQFSLTASWPHGTVSLHIVRMSQGGCAQVSQGILTCRGMLLITFGDLKGVMGPLIRRQHRLSLEASL